VVSTCLHVPSAHRPGERGHPVEAFTLHRWLGIDGSARRSSGITSRFRLIYLHTPDLRLTEDSDLYRLIIEGDFSEANLEQMTIEESQVRSAFVGADLGRPTAAVLELQRLAPIGSASHSS